MKRTLIIALLIAVGLAYGAADIARRTMNKKTQTAAMCTFTDEELKQKLTPEQFRIVRGNGTEKPFANAYWDNKEPGIYTDVVSGQPLFSSTDKFDSGTGWPSFTRPLDQAAVAEKSDDSLGTERTEVRSVKADSHLGHVFRDGPQPGGMRYCVNSESLHLVAVKDLAKEGLGRYLYLFTGESLKLGYGRATFAGGCFWGIQAYFKKVAGVLSVRSGYAGGTAKDPTYDQVCAGATGHAEAVDLIFDPKIVTYKRLLEHFWSVHDPVSMNRQGNDTGSQYRAAIFFHDEAQRAEAEGSKRALEISGKYGRPIVTAIEKASNFYQAEEYHQDYLDKHPGGYCHIDLHGATRN